MPVFCLSLFRVGVIMQFKLVLKKIQIINFSWNQFSIYQLPCHSRVHVTY